MVNIDLPSIVDRDPAHVLIVDDDPDLRQTIGAVLSRDGYKVTAVGNGQSAMSTVEREWVDLMILDVAMPGLSGVDVCRMVRNNMRTVALPIIMLTSREHVMAEVEGMLAGADAYLKKPVSPRWLLTNVKKLLNNS